VWRKGDRKLKQKIKWRDKLWLDYGMTYMPCWRI
jgi:hypothetical protein